MTKRLSSLSLAFLVCVALASACTSAFASHLRGTSISWSPTSTPGQVQFTLQYSQRASAGCTSGPCSVGSTVSVPFNFGDGATTVVSTTVTSLNSAEDYFSSTGTVAHTYTGNGPYTAFYNVCCRVSTIVSGHDQTMQMETTVSPFANPVNHSPVVSMPAIITLPLQATTGFFITASDLDHDVLSYRLSTATEMYGTGSFSCTAQQPSGLSVNSATGQVSWDTTQITKSCGFAAPKSGDLWTVQFMVQDLDANNHVKSMVPLDVILKFVSSTEAPPTLSLSNPGPITVQAGTPVTFTAMGNEAATNSRVTLNATGLPLGATVTNTNQALIPTVTSTFSWTPTTAQVGSYVITYSATNDTFEQVLASVTIYVQNILPPVLTCSAPLSVQYNTPIAIPLQVSDPEGNAVNVTWSVDGRAVRTDSVPPSKTQSTPSLSQTFTSLGAHTVAVTATDTQNLSSSCSTPITVVPADQSISFSSLTSMTYGDPAMVLSATATSGLPVTFAASGSCSISGGALHSSGAGSCSVTATQAGNANYHAATPLTKVILVNPAVLTVVANSVSRVYGTSNPAFSDIITGFVNGDPLSLLRGAAANTTTATNTSPVGTYLITPSLGTLAAPNYTFAFTAGRLSVTASPQTIIFTMPSAVSADSQLTLNGTGGASGNPVTYLVSGPATVSGNLLTILGPGSVTVTANQAGNSNYLAATPVTRAFTATVTATVTLHASSTAFAYPGSTNLNPCVTLANGKAAAGTISIYDGTALLTTQKVNGGGCFSWYIAPALSAGTHTLTAFYNDAVNSNVFSAPLTITVSRGAVTAEVDCWGHSFAYGPDIKCDANPDSGPSQGYMTYSYDGAAPVIVPLNSYSHALFTIKTPAVGTHTMVITYPQQGNWGSFTLPLQTFTVSAAPVNVALTPSTFYARAGTIINLSATITSWSAGPPNTIGSVLFYDGAKLLGTVPVDASGSARLSAGALGYGNHSITATYSGSSTYASGSSNVNVNIGH